MFLQKENPALGAAAGLRDASLQGSLDNPETIKSKPTTQGTSRNPVAVREARLELIREAIFENLGGARLFIETAQLLIDARDDTGMAHAVKMGAHHYRAAVLLAKDIAALKAEGQQ